MIIISLKSISETIKKILLMGKYLSKPITTKNSSCGEGKSVIFGASSMQGNLNV